MVRSPVFEVICDMMRVAAYDRMQSTMSLLVQASCRHHVQQTVTVTTR